MERKSKNLEKKNGKWKKTEHSRFMKAIQKYGKNWGQVQEYVKTRTLQQVRSHAQKFFLSMTQEQKKLFKNQQSRRERELCEVKRSKRKENNSEEKQEILEFPASDSNSNSPKRDRNEQTMQVLDEKKSIPLIPQFEESPKTAALELSPPNCHSLFLAAIIENYQRFGYQKNFLSQFSLLPICMNQNYYPEIK